MMNENVKLFNGDCLEVMDGLIEQGVKVDLTVTSPPYDNLRSYNGNNDLWNESVWKKVIEKLYKITSDGEQHFKPMRIFGGENGFKETKKRDGIKDTYCKKNNIPLLRIPYWEKDIIENILDEWLLHHLSDKKCQQKGDACDK